jgi:hypothetical protein
MEGTEAIEVSGEAPSTNGPPDCFICSPRIWRFSKETPITSWYHAGQVLLKHHISTQSGLNYLRTIGACLKNQLVARIGQGKRTFFVGIDTSSWAHVGPTLFFC